MRKILFWVGLIFILRLVLAFTVWHGDLNNHLDWGIRFWQYGPSQFYLSNVWSFLWPNQPPGTIYMFAIVRKLFELLFMLFSFLHFNLKIFPGSILLYFEQNLYPAMAKLPAILSDFGIAYLIYKFIFEDLKAGKKKAIAGALIFLLNPVVWYNSTIWGQYDSVINFLALLSFYFLLRKRLTISLLAFVLSLYIKASLLIFAPIFLIIAIRQRYKLKDYFISIVVSLVSIGLLTLPFSQREPFSWLFNLYKTKVFVDQLQIITANAFNIWAAIAGISARPQSLPFLGLTYQYWGYILFSIFYIPILIFVYKKQDAKSIVWSLAIASFSSFMFLTNMHERYLYPLFPYFTIIAVTQLETLANYIGVSIISILNTYNFWWVPFIPGLQDFLSFDDRLATRILGGINLLLFVFLYIRFLRLNTHKKIYLKR